VLSIDRPLHWDRGLSTAEMREFKWLRCRNPTRLNCRAEYDFEFG